MKTRFSLRTGLAGFALLLAAAVATGSAALASETPAAVAVDSDASVAAYPLTTCVVSGDKLADGDMGPPINYVYKEAGKSDRLVRLCCKGCIKKFNKEPAKYLKMIDDAAAAKGTGTVPPASDGHTGHSH